MNKLLIVHGYSDKSETFVRLRDFLRQENLYQDIRFIDYDSLDDQALLQDYADRLNDIYEAEYRDERIDILCHSTGSLVVRAWLALRRRRKLRRQESSLDVPVERLYMFAPANFGSDMAVLGQSFWNRIKRFASMGKGGKDKDDDSPWEIGKRILQGLEPASPDQWLLSQCDLHGEQSAGYFGISDGTNYSCFPFVFAAGRVEEFFGDRIIKEAIKPGTDTTVRICGTSLNTRKCILRPEGGKLSKDPIVLEVGNKAYDIPFAVFYDLNHTSIIGGRLNPGDVFSKERKVIDRSWSPYELLKAARNVTTVEQYNAVAEQFSQVNQANYAAWQQDQMFEKAFKDPKLLRQYRERYQQIFFRFIDDIDGEVPDVFIDFYVYDADYNSDVALTQKLDEIFLENEFYAHSINSAHKVVFFNYDQWSTFQETLKATGAKVILEILAKPTSSSTYYERCHQVIYDPEWPIEQQKGNLFFYPNTTTLIEIVLNRRQKDSLLKHVLG